MVTPRIARTLGGFHHWVLRSILGKLPKRRTDGGWEYPPIAEALREAGIKDLEVYIRRRQNTVAQFISIQTIIYFCLKAERCPGDRVPKK